MSCLKKRWFTELILYSGKFLCGLIFALKNARETNTCSDLFGIGWNCEKLTSKNILLHSILSYFILKRSAICSSTRDSVQYLCALVMLMSDLSMILVKLIQIWAIQINHSFKGSLRHQWAVKVFEMQFWLLGDLSNKVYFLFFWKIYVGEVLLYWSNLTAA